MPGLSTGNRAILPKRLGEKASAFKNGGFNPHFVVHGNYKNAHATKVSELEKGLLWGIYLTLGNNDIASTSRYYTIMCLTYPRIVYDGQEYALKDLSLSTCRRYLLEPNVKPIFTTFLTEKGAEAGYLVGSEDSSIRH